MKGLFGRSKDASTNTDSNVTSTGRVAIVVVNTIGEASVEQEVAVELVSGEVSTLILAVKDLPSGEQLRKRTLEAHPEGYCRIEVWLLDLANFASVKAFGQRMYSLASLDLFILGPAISTSGWEQTIDGYETGLQVNVLSTGLLCLLALPLMNRTAASPGQSFRPTMVVSSDECYCSSTIKAWNKSGSAIASLNQKKKFRGEERLSTVQLLNVYITRELSDLKNARSISVNCVLVLSTRVTGLSKLLPHKLKKTLLSSGDGPNSSRVAHDYLHAAFVSTTTGTLISNCEETEPSNKLVSSHEGMHMQKKCWAEMCAIWRKQSNDAAAVLMA